MIYNLDSTVSSDELHHIFGVYGEINEVRLNCYFFVFYTWFWQLLITGKPCSGMQIREAPQGSRHKSIEFCDIRAAEAALRELNKSDMGGKQMKLEPTHLGGSKRYSVIVICFKKMI